MNPLENISFWRCIFIPFKNWPSKSYIIYKFFLNYKFVSFKGHEGALARVPENRMNRDMRTPFFGLTSSICNQWFIGFSWPINGSKVVATHDLMTILSVKIIYDQDCNWFFHTSAFFLRNTGCYKFYNLLTALVL